MQIVIDIPKEDWEFIKESDGCRFSKAIIEGVINGIPLPKEHRGIVDLKNVQWAFDDAILEEALRTGQVKTTHDEIASILKTVPTIIDADKTESEEEE